MFKGTIRIMTANLQTISGLSCLNLVVQSPEIKTETNTFKNKPSTHNNDGANTT